MSIDAPLRRLFEAAPPPAEPPADHDERRARANATMLLIPRPESDDIASADHRIGPITVRVQRPSDAPSPAPAFLFLHGGGWFQGNLDTSEVECGPMASMAGAVVVHVDYRLAPEHPFPIPLDDCMAAYRWLLDNAQDLDVDPDRIALGGVSAGGNLAAALCLRARDERLPQPLVQLLEVPALDLTLTSASMDAMADGFGLRKADVEELSGFYVTPGQRTDPYASPLLADDLSGLAPVVVLVAELDPVRDDGERYVARLHDAGVPAAAFRVLSHIHGTWIIPLTITHALVRDLKTSVLRRAFEGTLRP